MAGKAAASSAAAAPAAGAAEAGEFDPVPFEVFAEPVPGKPGQSQSRAVFRVPEELVDVLVQRSIAARSAHFELRPGCGGDAGTFAAGSSDLEEEASSRQRVAARCTASSTPRSQSEPPTPSLGASPDASPTPTAQPLPRASASLPELCRLEKLCFVTRSIGTWSLNGLM
eukprot:TRINITY_DN6107_c0_g1_i1.p3 TRINITY_DN6107_c0_g1~~TRINITY_DN6107_c0_g1_i1.p3  ORF type:complete len:170 (-),score=42.10 TRINITY_DN6107_c0_g1_i1:70-579(-)